MPNIEDHNVRVWALVLHQRGGDLETPGVRIRGDDVNPLGAGELATVPIPAAIANAIFDATGARLREAPFTPKRVLVELQKKP